MCHGDVIHVNKLDRDTATGQSSKNSLLPSCCLIIGELTLQVFSNLRIHIGSAAAILKDGVHGWVRTWVSWLGPVGSSLSFFFPDAEALLGSLQEYLIGDSGFEDGPFRVMCVVVFNGSLQTV